MRKNWKWKVALTIDGMTFGAALMLSIVLMSYYAEPRVIPAIGGLLLLFILGVNIFVQMLMYRRYLKE